MNHHTSMPSAHHSYGLRYYLTHSECSDYIWMCALTWNLMMHIIIWHENKTSTILWSPTEVIILFQQEHKWISQYHFTIK
jgi:hypothetical protein